MAGFLSGLNTAAPTTPATATDPTGGSAADLSTASGLAGGSQSSTPQSPVDDGSGALSQLVSMRGSVPQNQNYASTLQGLATNGTSTTGASAPNYTGTGGNSNQLIADAKSWIGTPYSYGGTTKAGVDCSGFTQAVYGQLGYNIGRDTTAQFKSGTPVGVDGNFQATQSQLQPGDLLFYGQQGASGPNAHVVMYIGNGQVIQAAHTGTNVEVSPLFSAASSDEPFLGARSYISAAGNGGQQGQATGQLAQFMAAERQQESGGNYSIGPNADGASGAYQFTPGTWKAAAQAAGQGQYANGQAYQAPAAVQDAVAAHAMQGYYNQFGNWGDAAKAWYAGGGFAKDNQDRPQGNAPSINGYAQDVLNIMKTLL